MFDTLIKEIFDAVERNRAACAEGNVKESALRYGRFAAYADVLELMGHTVDWVVDEADKKNGYIEICSIELDGTDLMVEGVWTEHFFALVNNRGDGNGNE